MDECAVHGRRLLQLLQLFREFLHEWFSHCAANMWLCQVFGCQRGPVLWVCSAAFAFLPLHRNHHVAMIVQSHFADVTKACVLKELSEFCVAQSSLTEFHLVL